MSGAPSRPASACEEALAAARRFVRAGGAQDVDPPWRAHVAGCAVCRDGYRAEVELVATLHRGARKTPAQRERLAGLARAEIGARGGSRRALARVVLPAVGLLAVFALVSPAAGGHVAQLAWLAGEVHVGTAALGSESGPWTLQRGAVCTVGPGGRVRLGCDATTVWAEEGAAFLFERSEPPRLRLFAGTLLCSGPLVVGTAAGVLEGPAGSAAISVIDGQVRAVATAPGWRWTDATGALELASGAAHAVAIGAAGAR